MNRPFVPLDIIGVASPCGVSWESMTGDDRTRYCSQCSKNVYNLSNMTRSEAEALVNLHEGQLCVRFFRRGDGTILTQDCPVGARWARRKCAALVTSIAAAVALMVSSVSMGIGSSRSTTPPRHQRGLLTRFGAWLDPPLVRPTPITGEAVMVDVALPQPTLGKLCVPPQPARPNTSN